MLKKEVRMSRRAALLAAFVLTVGCAHKPDSLDSTRAAVAGLKERAGLVLPNDPYGDGATKLVYLDQGWSVPETLWYYFADQGSVLLPYEVMVHLEQPESEKLIIDPEHLARYRFLAQHPTPNNPDGLPVGFSRHGDQAGLTCAACHTGQITYRGTAMRIDGAPTLANVMGFIARIREALGATLADEAKLARFASAMRGGGAAPSQREAARKLLSESKEWFDGYITANHSSTVEGFGRIDAVGRILNQVIRFTSDPKNSAEPNAPNSFPILWDAPRHDYVQWAGFNPNAEAGSIGRNVGEVVGVFSHVEVKHYETDAQAKKGYASTIEGNAVVAMEESLRGLESPRWPEDVLPPIDRAKAARGAELYRSNCISCHALIDRADPNRKVTAMVTAIDVVGTDSQSADNLIHLRAPSGILEGAISTDGKRKYGAVESGLTLLEDVVTRLLSAQPTAVVRTLANAKRFGLEKTDKQGDYHKATDADPTADLRSYKARPLNGMWAAAPYLHNGSVPSLHDLLRPAAARPKKFAVGRWEYDPKKVGYVSDGETPWVYDTSVTGNHNGGHEYGTSLPDDDRWALVEYLKTL